MSIGSSVLFRGQIWAMWPQAPQSKHWGPRDAGISALGGGIFSGSRIGRRGFCVIGIFLVGFSGSQGGISGLGPSEGSGHLDRLFGSQGGMLSKPPLSSVRKGLYELFQILLH